MFKRRCVYFRCSYHFIHNIQKSERILLFYFLKSSLNNLPTEFQMWFFLILLLLPEMYSCTDEMDYIPKDWLDPNDMRNYDRNTKTMKNSYHISDPASCSVCQRAQEENQRLEIFIERFINRLLQSANLKVNLSHKIPFTIVQY